MVSATQYTTVNVLYVFLCLLAFFSSEEIFALLLLTPRKSAIRGKVFHHCIRSSVMMCLAATEQY